jgi:diketogulonate reductase-like aldo/keto reductase
LLTANADVLRHPLIVGIAKGHDATTAQVVFRFAQLIGILPLTRISHG